MVNINERLKVLEERLDAIEARYYMKHWKCPYCGGNKPVRSSDGFALCDTCMRIDYATTDIFIVYKTNRKTRTPPNRIQHDGHWYVLASIAKKIEDEFDSFKVTSANTIEKLIEGKNDEIEKTRKERDSSREFMENFRKQSERAHDRELQYKKERDDTIIEKEIYRQVLIGIKELPHKCKDINDYIHQLGCLLLTAGIIGRHDTSILDNIKWQKLISDMENKLKCSCNAYKEEKRECQ